MVFEMTRASAASTTSSGTSDAMPDKAALDKAMMECATSATKDSSGRPDMKAMDACMSAKGFTKPSGAPSGRPSGPPPN